MGRTKVRLTAKQEGFVADVATGSTLADAYRNNYNVDPNCEPNTIWSNASQLLSEAKVTQRLVELQQMAAEKTLVTIASITEELEEARQMAIDTDQAGAMTGASMGKAKVNGLLIDKAETEVKMNVSLSGDDTNL